MENYDNVLKYTTASLEAAGTSQQKYDAYMDSIQAHLNNLTSTWQGFINNMNASGTFNLVIDMVSELVKILDLLLNKFQLLKVLAPASIFVLLLNPISKLVNHFGILGSRVSQFNTILSQGNLVIEKNSQDAKALGEAIAGLTVKQQVAILSRTKLNEEQKEAILVNAGLTSAQAKTALSTTAVGTATAAASAKVTLLSNAFNGLKVAFLSNPIGLAITAITTVVSIGTMAWQSYNQKIQETIDKGKELSESFKNFNSENESAISSLKSLEEEFDKLSDGVSDYGENISLSADDYERYQEIVAEILGYSPELISGYNKEGKAIANKNGLLEESIRLMEQERKERLKTFVDEDIEGIGKGKAEELKQLEEDARVLRNDLIYGRNGISEIFDPGLWGDAVKEKKNIKLQELLGIDYIDPSDRTIFNRYGTLIADNVEEIYKMMLENTDLFTKEDLSLFERYINDKNALYSSITDGQKALNPSLQVIPQIITGYENLTDGGKNFVSEYIYTFKITGYTTTEEIEGMKNEITDFTTLLINSESSVRNLINKMFSINPETISADSYKESIENILNLIPDELLSEEQKTNLMVKFGIVVVDENGNIIDRESQMKDVILEKFKGLTEEDLGELTYTELEILVNAEGVDSLTGSGLLEYIERLKAESAVASGEIQDMSAIMSGFAADISNIYSQYDILNSTIDEFNTYGAISANTLKSLTDNNLLQYLEFTSNGIRINTQELLNNAESAKATAIEKVKMTAYEQLLALAMREEAEAANTSNEATTNAGEAAQTAAQKFANGIPSVTGYTAALLAFEGVSGKTIKSTEEANAIIDEMNTRIQAILNTSYEFSGTGSNLFGGFSKSANSAAGSVNKMTDAIKEQTEALKEQKEELENGRDAIEDFMDMAMEMIKQEYKDRESAIEDEIDAENDKYDAWKDNLDRQKDLAERYYDDRLQELEDLKDATEEVYDEQIDQIEKEMDAYEKKIELQKKLLEAKKEEEDYQKELAEKVKDVAEIESELAKLQFDDSIEAQKKKIELLEQLEEKRGEVDDFQSDHAYDKQQDALDEELDRYQEMMEQKKQEVEDLKDAELNAIDEEIEAFKRSYELWKRHIEDIEYIQEQAHNKSIAEKEAEIEKLKEYYEVDGNLFNEASQRMEEQGYKNSQFYQDLIEWNRQYGTGVNESLHPLYSNV